MQHASGRLSVAHPRDGDAEVREALAPFGLASPDLDSLGPRPSPIDIACELCRAMEVGRITKGGKTFVQTVYSVGLAIEDMARYEDRKRELVATFKDALSWWASQHGYTPPGDFRVRLIPNQDLRTGQVEIEAALRAEEAAKLGRRSRAE